ncbi:MAG: electron transport complex subunit RsxG [Magnetospiraceae bacterium]
MTETDKDKETETPAPSRFERIKGNMVYHALMLGAFAMGAAAILGGGDQATVEAIAARFAEDLTASLAQVVPDDMYDNDLLADTLTITGDKGPVVVHRGRKEGRITAFAYPSMAFGYGGKIQVIMGVDASGKILGVRVVQHAETPGLGDKIDIARDTWILSFDGRSFDTLPADKWAVKKDGGVFDQFSGATITPRAVVRAVKEGLEFFHAHEDELLGASGDQEMGS